MKLFGVSPAKPWVLNSSKADLILVESRAMRDYMMNEGLPADQIKITGSLANDILYENRNNPGVSKNSIFSKFGLPTNKVMILTSLPSNDLAGQSRPEFEFENYEKMIEFWVRSLARVGGANVIVSLHPSANYDAIKHIEDVGVKIFRGNIKQVIPFCDFFVAAISSTIQWAIVCGKPVINYDVYKYQYTDYESVDSVLYAGNKGEFLRQLDLLGNNNEKYSSILNKAAKSVTNWGEMDGRCGERIVNSLTDLIRAGKVS